MKILKKITPVILILIFLGCSSNSKLYISPAYRSLEHGNNTHTAEELQEECRRTRAEINYLKNKIKVLKGPGAAGIKAQAERDIEWLEGKFSEAGCNDISLLPPRPLRSEHKHTETHQIESEYEGSIQPTKKEIKSIEPLSFDECFQKCKELTNRTNEQCFDACVDY